MMIKFNEFSDNIRTQYQQQIHDILYGKKNLFNSAIKRVLFCQHEILIIGFIVFDKTFNYERHIIYPKYFMYIID